MKRIVFISDQFYPRTSADSEQIVSSLSALGRIVHTILISASYKNQTPVSKEELETYYQDKITFDLQFTAHLFKNIRGLEKISFALRSAYKIKNMDIDAVYTRNIPVVMSILLCTDLPIFFESYRPWPSQNAIAKWFFDKLANHKRFKGVVLHSNFAAKSYREIGFSDEKLIVAHNAVNLDKYGSYDKEETLKLFDLPKDKLIVTYSGRVSVDKGLLRIFELAKAFPEVLFLIVGSENEGEIEIKAEVFSNIKILKWQDKRSVFRLLLASDILYIPNSLQAREKALNTVLPLKTFLYKASGIPIIAPNIEDITEVLTNNKTAILVEPDDLKDEIRGLNLLLNNEELRKKIGEDAKKEMEGLTWEKRAERVFEFFTSNMEARS